MATHPIHHITAICSNAQENLDFYVGVLGLRFVKRTINFDDPGTYHFYFGDEAGSPGTILTFFPWDAMSPGKLGTGQAIATAYAVPPGSLEKWEQRLKAAGVPSEPIASRFGERVLAFADGDGLVIELIETPWALELAPWTGDGVGADMALRAFHSASVSVSDDERTARVLQHHLGFQQGAEENSRLRFVAKERPVGGVIDLLRQPDRPRGMMGTGTVHHIAFRASDDDDHLAVRAGLLQSGFNVTPVIDRTYFKSIYFREPAGTIFEVATDAPGMDVDEPRESLGESLRLPEWMESNRQQIESILPPIQIPGRSNP